jgi:hypothetical protein
MRQWERDYAEQQWQEQRRRTRRLLTLTMGLIFVWGVTVTALLGFLR